MIFYVLIGEACGLGSCLSQHLYSRVSVTVGTAVVVTSLQASTAPLWNELLELEVDSLPRYATVTTEVFSGADPSENKMEKSISFDFHIDQALNHGFCDEWITSSARDCDSGDCCDKPRNLSLKLHISCTLVRDIANNLQRGLWPCQPVSDVDFDESDGEDLNGAMGSFLMQRIPLTFGKIRSQNRRRASLLPDICLGRDSPSDLSNIIDKLHDSLALKTSCRNSVSDEISVQAFD